MHSLLHFSIRSSASSMKKSEAGTAQSPATHQPTTTSFSAMSGPPPPQTSYPYPPITIVLAVILLIFFFVGFFSIYFCRCFVENLFSTLNIQSGTSINLRGPNSRNPSDGLDPKVLNSFPTFRYSSVKDLRQEKHGLECAICLAEFEDQSVLRLMTVCYHVFHQDCIDLWLEGHKTCPVCRENLDLPLEKLLEKPPVVARESNIHRFVESNSTSEDDAVRIDIKESGDEDGTRRLSQIRPDDDAAQESASHEIERKQLPRSHTTGHLADSNQEEVDDDRYRLRLQPHIKVEITRGRGHSDSSIIFTEIYGHHRTNANGEVSGCSKGDINNV